ncbi:hypothetical protein BGY98DRAFT_934738, partial [Russula aff. rugulosa BPL654]
MLTFSVQMSVHFSLFLYVALLPTCFLYAPNRQTLHHLPLHCRVQRRLQTRYLDKPTTTTATYVGRVLNAAPSPTAETEHVRQGVHEILQRPLHNNQNIIDAPVPDWL